MTAVPEPAELLALACAVACEAGAMLAAAESQPEVVMTKSSPTDVVTQLDQASERLIRQRILAARPADVILGEESGQIGQGGPVRWVVDPLDGTVNYLYGLPDWAVSVAAEVGGQVVAGAVCVPSRASLYGASLGGGAWRSASLGFDPGSLPSQRSALACTSGVRLDAALVATGFGYDPRRRAVQGRVAAAVLPLVRDIRRCGACAVDLCMLAAGHVDGYYERGVQLWDIAAGSLIAREAGATVSGLARREAGPSMTVAAGPGLFAELRHLLLRLDAERDD